MTRKKRRQDLEPQCLSSQFTITWLEPLRTPRSFVRLESRKRKQDNLAMVNQVARQAYRHNPAAAA